MVKWNDDVMKEISSMKSILPSFGRDVSIDIGTSMTRVMGGTRESMMSEPSIVATDTKLEKIVAVGDDAARIVRRMPDMWRSLSPLQDGFIVDYRVMHTMLNYFLHKVSNALRRSRVLVGVPCGMTDVAQRAMMDAVIQAGAREVFLIERPVAAAIGCGLPIFAPRGSMVIDMGAGTVDMGIISLGGIVHSKTIRFGGTDIDKALMQYINECFGLLVSEQTVEDIKHTVGTTVLPVEEQEFSFTGRDMTSGIVRRSVIHQSEVYQVISTAIEGFLDAVNQMIRNTEPELVADIMQHGIVLTGGSARLVGMAERISSEIGVPVTMADEPELMVVKGLYGSAKHIVELSRFIVNTKDRKGRA